MFLAHLHTGVRVRPIHHTGDRPGSTRRYTVSHAWKKLLSSKSFRGRPQVGEHGLLFKFSAHMLARRLAIQPPRNLIRGIRARSKVLTKFSPSHAGPVDRVGCSDYGASLIVDTSQHTVAGTFRQADMPRDEDTIGVLLVTRALSGANVVARAPLR